MEKITLLKFRKQYADPKEANGWDESKSVSSLSASDIQSSDLEESNSSQNTFEQTSSSLLQEIPASISQEMPAPFSRTIARVIETGFRNLGQDKNLFIPPHLFPKLPTLQEVREIREFQDCLKLKALENKHRTSIAKSLILYILRKEPDKKLIREDFLILADYIVEIFPSEIRETYYVPFRKGCLARGKLNDAYNNTKSRLRAEGVIRRRFKAKSDKQGKVDKVERKKEVSNISNTEDCYDADETDFEILKSDGADWDLVLKIWKNTHGYRQKELKMSHLRTIDYFEKYKVLLNKKSYELFEMDFKMLYPKSKNIYEWKVYYRQIIAKVDKLKEYRVKEILLNIQNMEDEDSKLALSFMLLPFLLPNCRQKTKSELLDFFITYCKDDTIVDSEKGLKIDCLPKIYLSSDEKNTIRHAFVDFSGIRLKFENPMKAIEVCFHCFIGMNISYPKYISHIWILIQKLIFDVTTTSDVVLPSITTLMNDLKSEI